MERGPESQGQPGPRGPTAQKEGAETSRGHSCSHERAPRVPPRCWDTHLKRLAVLHLSVREGQRALDQILQHQEVDVVHTARDRATVRHELQGAPWGGSVRAKTAFSLTKGTNAQTTRKPELKKGWL